DYYCLSYDSSLSAYVF
nr:immunoglobulin light chain junction region [Macaca mulatta]MOX33199.1 immunoglobulin light chain junction region [Macaca mulatta]MOX33202.1 immunoglobulin light chain junction region [Macaca mulatta]MOX33293.1 immunoglobulin light chain junction region [Macaca mulatta]MOX33294.1 immunoglobulin light chain junction region [Macaca mulatta]